MCGVAWLREGWRLFVRKRGCGVDRREVVVRCSLVLLSSTKTRSQCGFKFDQRNVRHKPKFTLCFVVFHFPSQMEVSSGVDQREAFVHRSLFVHEHGSSMTPCGSDSSVPFFKGGDINRYSIRVTIPFVWCP